jgi:formiminoglutamate deiminase
MAFPTAQALFFERALLPGGWARDVRARVDRGAFASVAAGARPEPGDLRIACAVPGLPNLHSHAFQRGMAGLGERRGPNPDSFWTWRDVMYRFLDRLTPDDVEAVAAQACVEMLESGFTTLCEFHYLHHDADGRPYADLAEMGARIAAAAQATGIGLTLLPSLYRWGGVAAQPPTPGQRRFLNDLDRFLALREATLRAVAPLEAPCVGIAPHSLRAVDPALLRDLLNAVPDGPVHIHAAEQTKEVEDCLAWSGARPVQWLLDHAGVDARWCLIHCTHMTADETTRLARSGAVAGLCPATEASLGDGIFDGVAFAAQGGVYGVGSDSNVVVDAGQELRLLELSQRLRDRTRNALATREGSTGRQTFEAALAGGARASGRAIGAIAPGLRADVVGLAPEHAALVGKQDDDLLDGWIFAARASPVDAVIVGGRRVVADGRHLDAEAIASRFAATMRRLLA